MGYNNYNFTEEGIRHLAQLPHLEMLKIDSEDINDEMLKEHGLLGKVLQYSSKVPVM